MHYVGLSRVKTIEGLHITDLCEAKIAVSSDVQKEMERLRTEGKLTLSITSLYETDQLCYLNTRSLHKHIQDIRKDFNYSSTSVNVFSETRFTHSDSDSMYEINE